MQVSAVSNIHDQSAGSLNGEVEIEPDRPAQTSVDQPRIQRAVREILAAVGEDPDREGLRETPAASPACTPSCSPDCTKTLAGTYASSLLKRAMRWC